MGHKGPVSKTLGASWLQGTGPTCNQSFNQSVNHCSLVNIVTPISGSKLQAGLITSTPILIMEFNCWSRTNMLPCPQFRCTRDQIPRHLSRCTADLTLLNTNNSSGGRQTSVLTTLVGVVLTAPVFPKHGSVWTLLSFFVGLSSLTTGHQTKDANAMVGLIVET
jgi:hypothetical protein